MSVMDYFRGHAGTERPLEIVITTGVEGALFGVEARTGPRTAYNPPLRDQVAGRLAVVAKGGRATVGGMRIEDAWKGRGVEALLKKAANLELERRAKLRQRAGGVQGSGPRSSATPSNAS